MRNRAWKTLGLMIFLLFCILAASILLFPSYQPLAVSGPYEIGTVRYTFIDEQRAEVFSSTGKNRQVNVVFWYPEDVGGDETYPLVVFSHGGLGTETSNESLYRELASHGYVVGAIGHPYHAFWTKSEDGRTTFVNGEYFREILSEDAKSGKEQSHQYYQRWLETRTTDINFVIDTVLARTADGAGGVYALIDCTKIGLMGHSLGGSAALAIPRQRHDIAAVIALESPFLYDIVGVENNNFLWLDEAYPIPVLNIYSDSSWSHLSEWSQYARNAALLSDTSQIATSLYLPGAGHFSLTDLSLTSPLLTSLLEGGKPEQDRVEYLQKVNQACLEFLNRYLKNFDETKGN
jgi:dienelactone hydrolase